LDKAPDAFRTISEVAEEINVPQHVLRFWETRFTQIRPLKRGGGRRYYRPDDVNLLRGVRHLLYGEGYTIRGVQRILREEGLSFVQEVWRPGAELPLLKALDDEVDNETANEADKAENRAAPRLSGEPSFFDASSPTAGSAAPGGETAGTRREPTIVPPLPTAGIDSENRRKLQSALDELMSCRRVIDAALEESSFPDD
jgi:DNA-binding transcriptional MerR regulator